jgi:hypothetical protein
MIVILITYNTMDYIGNIHNNNILMVTRIPVYYAVLLEQTGTMVYRAYLLCFVYQEFHML